MFEKGRKKECLRCVAKSNERGGYSVRRVEKLVRKPLFEREKLMEAAESRTGFTWSPARVYRFVTTTSKKMNRVQIAGAFFFRKKRLGIIFLFCLSRGCDNLVGCLCANAITQAM
jgi:hypothetical protein